MKTLLFAALITATAATAACSKKRSECDTGIDKAMATFKATLEANTTDPRARDAQLAIIDKIHTTLATRCNADGWSAEAIACFAATASQKDVRTCESKLNKEQRGKRPGGGKVSKPGGRPAGPPGKTPGHLPSELRDPFKRK